MESTICRQPCNRSFGHRDWTSKHPWSILGPITLLGDWGNLGRQRQRRRRWRLCGLALVTVAWATPGRAETPKRVVVEPFSGTEATSLRAALIEDLQQQPSVVMVPLPEVNEAKRRLKLRSLTRSKDYRRLSHALNVAVFVSGSVRRDRRSWVLAVRVRNGATGEVEATPSWSGRTLAALRTVRRTAYQRLAKAMAASEPAGPEAERVKAPVAAVAVLPAGAGNGAATGAATNVADPQGTAAAPWFSGIEPTASSPIANPVETAAAESAVQPTDRNQRWEAFSLGLEFGFLFRDLSAQAGVFERFRNPMLATTNNNVISETRKYQSGAPGGMELGVRAEFYPGAFGRRQLFPWLGVVGSFHHSLALGLDGPPCTQPGCPTMPVSLGVTQSELYAGLRGRVRFKHPQHGPRLFFDVGFDQFRFMLDSNDLAQTDRSTIVPPLVYNTVQFGAGVRFSLVRTYLIMSLNAGGRFGLSLGDGARRIWGTQTKAGHGVLLGMELRSEAPYLFRGAYWTFNTQFFGYFTKFRGQTACRSGNCPPTANNNPDLWEPWPYEGTDTEKILPGGGIKGTVKDLYLRFNFGFGYAFR